MRMHNFWAQNGPIPQIRIFFLRKPINEPFFFIHAYLHAENQSQISIKEILTIKEYWNLIGREPFLAKVENQFFPSMQFSHNVNEP